MVDIGIPAVNFYSMLSGLGDTIQANRVAQAKKDAFAAATTPGPDGKVDYGKAILGLAQVDPQSASLLATIQKHKDMMAHQATEDARNASNDQFTHGIQTKQLAISQSNSEKPIFHEVTDPNTGNKTLVRLDSDGNNPVVIQPPGGPSQPNNPFAYGPKMNENQSKDSGFANRLFRSEGVLRDPSVINAGTSLVQKGMEELPVVGNYMTSPARQRYDQASRDFVNAVLRRESGAAISQSEFDNAYKQYLPQPGDTKERLAEKQKNRQDTIASIAGGGGPSYKPPLTFGPNGELVPTGNAQQGVVAPKQGAAITQEQYAALPPGTPYTAPDGSQRIKR